LKEIGLQESIIIEQDIMSRHVLCFTLLAVIMLSAMGVDSASPSGDRCSIFNADQNTRKVGSCVPKDKPDCDKVCIAGVPGSRQLEQVYFQLLKQGYHRADRVDCKDQKPPIEPAEQCCCIIL